MAGEKGHQPSEEEVKKAKEMMSDEQNEMSTERAYEIFKATENRTISERREKRIEEFKNKILRANKIDKANKPPFMKIYIESAGYISASDESEVDFDDDGIFLGGKEHGTKIPWDRIMEIHTGIPS